MDNESIDARASKPGNLYEDLKGFHRQIERLEASPTSTRLFSEVYKVGLDYVEKGGLKDGQGRKVTVSDRENEITVMLSHHNPSWIYDFISLAYSTKVNGDHTQQALLLTRRRGHLTEKEQSRKDRVAKITRGRNLKEMISGLVTMQPFTLLLHDPNQNDRKYEY